MTGDSGLDLLGAGKLARAIPAKAWVQVVGTACDTFTSAIAPFTATTSGIGRLITAKFDRLVDAEKVLAAQTMARATEKVTTSKKTPNGTAKASIVIAAIESSATETDGVLRELWANLLAQELVTGSVHPEFPRVLSRLSSSDAKVLAQIAEREGSKSVDLKRAIKRFTASISILGAGIAIGVPDEERTFTHEHLVSLNLTKLRDGAWALTLTGQAFIQSVTDSWHSDRVV